jgi:hypothetical protein
VQRISGTACEDVTFSLLDLNSKGEFNYAPFAHSAFTVPIVAMEVDTTSANGQTVSAHLVNRFRKTADKFVGLADTTFFEITSFEVCFVPLCDEKGIIAETFRMKMHRLQKKIKFRRTRSRAG